MLKDGINCGFCTSPPKDQVTEEWAREFIKDGYDNNEVSDAVIDSFIRSFKLHNRIRKSKLEEAREKTDEWINNVLEPQLATSNKLKQLIQAERKIVDEINISNSERLCWCPKVFDYHCDKFNHGLCNLK
jgi:hypothetical protein